MMQSPILITGIERSGSSIIAKIVSACGAFTGPVTSMQENKRIGNLVSNFYVQHLGIPSRGQFPLPEIPCLCETRDWQEKVNAMLKEDGYTEDKIWMYKNSRIGQIWPIWNVAYPEAKWIIVRRRNSDIVQSCLKTGWMNAFNKDNYQRAVGAETVGDAWLWWIKQHEKRFAELVQAGVQYKEVWPERMAVGDYEQIHEMIEWLGLQWNDNIIPLVTPLLKNSLQKERSI